MRLATVKAVMDGMGVFNNGASISSNASVEAALDITSRIIEGVLETSLEEASYTDFFSFNPRRYDTTSVYVLRLSNSFLLSDEAVTVKQTEDGLPLYDAVGGVTVADRDYILDAPKGLLTLLKEPPHGAYSISITYTSGFQTDTATKTLRGIPDWLTKAAVLAAHQYLLLSPAHVSSKKTNVLDTQKAAITSMARTLLSPHLRTRYVSLWPERVIRYD